MLIATDFVHTHTHEINKDSFDPGGLKSLIRQIKPNTVKIINYCFHMIKK